MDALDKRQKQADADKARTTIKDNNATIFNSAHQVVLGNPQGKVTMVEFFDYNCALLQTRASRHGRPVEDRSRSQIRAQGISGARRRLGRSGPRRGRRPHAGYVPEQNTSSFTRSCSAAAVAADKARALAVAKEVGFDMARIQKDMDSDEVKKTIDENMKLADALGVSGTPSYVVGDRSRRRRGRDRRAERQDQGGAQIALYEELVPGAASISVAVKTTHHLTFAARRRAHFRAIPASPLRGPSL